MQDQDTETRDAGNQNEVAGAGAGPRAAAPSTTMRKRAKRTVTSALTRLPDYLRMLAGVMRDKRVSAVDKLLVGGAIAYVILPLDFLPDMIPFLGQVDDLFLLVLAVSRLLDNAGRRVILSHWRGDPGDLDPRWLRRVLMAASVFLPRRTRKRLRDFARNTQR